VFTQDVVQDESFKLDESFTNSFINELMMVRVVILRLQHWLWVHCFENLLFTISGRKHQI